MSGADTETDPAWVGRAGPVSLQIALATFGILALELALIRWTAGQVRAFAYFNNLVLIASFLGMGLGLALGRRRGGLMHWTLPALLGLALVLGLAEPLGLVHLRFPDPAVNLWGAEQGYESTLHLVGNFALFLALIAAVVLVFLIAGSAVGCLFPRLPALAAYRFDLLGSLLGVLAVTAATAAGSGPAVWLALGVAPFAWLSRRALPCLAGLAVLALGAYSERGATFSPYNRIDLFREPDSLRLEVNRDFHQFMHDLSDRGVEGAQNPERARSRRVVYDLPFVVNDQRESALVVGAGTGNDVAAALRNGYRRVVSVDIDPEIVALGRELHPERPYDDAGVEAVVNDARAYFEERKDERFDAVVFGLLDSHAMFTALSTLRLDNYVYTEEGIRAAWEHVAPEGHLSVSFSVFAGAWIHDRLYWTIARATGREPVAFLHRMHYACTYLVPGPAASLQLDAVPFPRPDPFTTAEVAGTTSDDWPFLYVRPGVFPWGYVVVLGFLVLLAAGSAPLAFGKRTLGRDFDAVLFLMGAGFLLIETRGVTALSLLFGSTWVVNAAVFSGILLMALLANEAVIRLRPTRALPWFLGLLASVVVLWVVPPAALSGLPLVARGIVGGLVNGLPVGFAGVVVSMLLARSRNPAASLGSNLLGAVVGGSLEYLSMLVGLRALAVLAFALYLAALLATARRGRSGEGRPPGLAQPAEA
jgi:SAM-dependent methyltransferase